MVEPDIAHIENRKAGIPINNDLVIFALSRIFILYKINISESEQNRYGTSMVIVPNKIIKVYIDTNPLEEVEATEMLINTLLIISPSTGAPLLFVFLNIEGKRLSLAMAIGTCPCSNIHPFSAPNVAAIAPRLTIYFPQLPHILNAASANGAVEFCSSPGEIKPKTANELNK